MPRHRRQPSLQPPWPPLLPPQRRAGARGWAAPPLPLVLIHGYSVSGNTFTHPSIPTRDVNFLLVEAWRMGVKGLYYQMSVNAAQAFARNILDCKSCQ